MSLALLDSSIARERLHERLGVEPTSDEALADLLRTGVHARGQTPRALALGRVSRLLRPVVDVDEERLATACDSLVREGDLICAPGAVLAATPLRAVPLASRVARLYSSLPNTTLAALLGVPSENRGATRTVVWEDGLSASVEKAGGRVLSPEAWAGLDHVPPADDALLSRLDERLAWESETAGSLEGDGLLDWLGWVPDGQPPAWRREAGGSRLWWARTAYRGHRRAWAAGNGSPAECSFISLTADEADRTRFALLRLAGASPPVFIERSEGHSILEVPAWLPRPEYRWLSLQAEMIDDSSQGARWRLPPDEESLVAALLSKRLGLKVEAR